MQRWSETFDDKTEDNDEINKLVEYAEQSNASEALSCVSVMHQHTDVMVVRELTETKSVTLVESSMNFLNNYVGNVTAVEYN